MSNPDNGVHAQGSMLLLPGGGSAVFDMPIGDFVAFQDVIVVRLRVPEEGSNP